MMRIINAEKHQFVHTSANKMFVRGGAPKIGLFPL